MRTPHVNLRDRSTEADPVSQPRRVADKRTPLDTTRPAHVETTRLPSGHTNTVTTRTSERLPTLVHEYRGRQPHNGHGRHRKDEDGAAKERSLPPRDEARERQRRTGAAETARNDGDERRGDDFSGDPWTKARRGRRNAWRRGGEDEDDDGAAAAHLTDADDGRERLDGGTNATTMRTTTGTGEEATRAAGSGCTETRTVWNTPLRIRRRRRRRETTSRRGGTMTTTTNTGGVRSKGRRGRGRPCCCDAGGGGGAADGARVEEGPTGEIPARRMERPAWHGGVLAKQRSSRRRGRCCDVDEGDGDVGRRSGAATEATEGGTVAATPLFCRRGRVSDDFPAKRGRSRGRGGSCDAGRGDGTAGRRADAAAGAAGDRPAPEREKGRRGEVVWPWGSSRRG
uniref:Uncharacterized protein n=1 Tax=Oryza sativa subsp. japonica TaxID=39947 RepID=Q8LIK5_ORYSJ|nr:hypothetical protein [Oryza sativa Japonica Group]